MPTIPNSELTLVTQVEEVAMSHRIATRVCYTSSDDGSLRNFLTPEPFADLVFSCYIDSREDGPSYVWGHHYGYESTYIRTASDARALANMLARIERGLDKLSRERGSLRGEDDYAAFIGRVASILRVPTMHVRNGKGHREMTGDRYRTVDTLGLEYFVDGVTRHHRANELRSEYIAR